MTAPGMMAPIFAAPAAGGGCGCSPAYVTGNRTGSIAVSDSGIKHSSAGPINNLVDGGLAANDTDATYFQGATVAGHWIAFDFGSGNSIKITEATWRQDTSNRHGSWKWQGSHNGTEWTDIGGAFALGGTAQVPS
jgi:hypothetical protein